MTTDERDSPTDRLAGALAELPEVRLGYLFGSRALGRGRKDSDFDVAVLVDEATARSDRGTQLRHLAGRLGREVSSALLDLVILNDAPSLLRHRVLRDGVLLFERSPEDRVRFAIKAIRDYQDGSFRREELTRRRIDRLKAESNHGGSRDLLEKARSVAKLFRKAESVSRDQRS